MQYTIFIFSTILFQIQCVPLDHPISDAIQESCQQELKATDRFLQCLPRCILLKQNELNLVTGEPILEKFMIPEIATKCNQRSKSMAQCKREQHFTECLQQETEKHMNQLFKKCAKETKIQAHELDFAKEEHACFNRCMMLKLGLMNDSNEVVVSRIEKTVMFASIDVNDAVRRCNDANMQEYKCLQATKRSECLYEAAMAGGTGSTSPAWEMSTVTWRCTSMGNSTKNGTTDMATTTEMGTTEIIESEETTVGDVESTGGDSSSSDGATDRDDGDDNDDDDETDVDE